jgi:hypothetical protein
MSAVLVNYLHSLFHMYEYLGTSVLYVICDFY